MKVNQRFSVVSGISFQISETEVHEIKLYLPKFNFHAFVYLNSYQVKIYKLSSVVFEFLLHEIYFCWWVMLKGSS